MIFMKLVQVILTECLYVTHMLIMCEVCVLTLQEVYVPPNFNMYLAISQCVAAVIF